jgi:hypothetical protein
MPCGPADISVRALSWCESASTMLVPQAAASALVAVVAPPNAVVG